MSTRFVKITRWLLGVTLFLIPLVYWYGVFFPHVFMKVVVFRILVECAVVSWVGLLYLRPEYRLRSSWVLWSVLAWMSLLLLSMAFGVNAYKSWWSDFERMTGVFTQLHLLLFAAMLASVMRQKIDWIWCFRVSAASASLVALAGLIEATQTDGRIIATIGNASFLATYMLGALCIIAWLFVDSWSQKRRSYGALLVYGILGILIAVVLVLTGSRGAVLGLLGGVVFFCAWVWWFARGLGAEDKVRYTLLRRIALGVLVGTIACGSLVLLTPDFVRRVAPPALQRIVSIDIGQRTATGRLLAWQVAWRGFQERPMLGWGPENFNVLFDKYYDWHLYEQEPWFDRAHNVVFDIGSTSGTLGLLAYLGIFFTAWWMLIRTIRQRPEEFLTSSVVAMFFAAYLVQNMFTFDVLTSLLILYLFLAYVATEELLPLSQKVQAPTRKRYPVWLGVMSGAVLIATLYGANVHPFLANAKGHLGWEELRNLGSDQKAMSYFDQAIAYGTHGNTNLRRFSADYVFEFIKQGGKRPDESMHTLFLYAMRRVDENIVADPQNVKWPMYAGQLANLYAVRYGDPSYAQKAEVYYLNAKRMSPQRLQIYLEIAQARKVQGNIAGLWEALREGLAFAPDMLMLHINAMAHAIDLGDTARERTEVAWLVEHDVAHDLIRDAYFKKQRYKDAAEFQDHYVGQAIGNAGYDRVEVATRYAQLAMLRFYAGEIERARAAAGEVLKYDNSPGRQGEVQEFLKLLNTKR